MSIVDERIVDLPLDIILSSINVCHQHGMDYSADLHLWFDQWTFLVAHFSRNKSLSDRLCQFSLLAFNQSSFRHVDVAAEICSSDCHSTFNPQQSSLRLQSMLNSRFHSDSEDLFATQWLVVCVRVRPLNVWSVLFKERALRRRQVKHARNTSADPCWSSSSPRQFKNLFTSNWTLIEDLEEGRIWCIGRYRHSSSSSFSLLAYMNENFDEEPSSWTASSARLSHDRSVAFCSFSFRTVSDWRRWRFSFTSTDHDQFYFQTQWRFSQDQVFQHIFDIDTIILFYSRKEKKRFHQRRTLRLSAAHRQCHCTSENPPRFMQSSSRCMCAFIRHVSFTSDSTIQSLQVSEWTVVWWGILFSCSLVTTGPSVSLFFLHELIPSRLPCATNLRWYSVRCSFFSLSLLSWVSSERQYLLWNGKWCHTTFAFDGSSTRNSRKTNDPFRYWRYIVSHSQFDCWQWDFLPMSSVTLFSVDFDWHRLDASRIDLVVQCLQLFPSLWNQSATNQPSFCRCRFDRHCRGSHVR